MINIGVVRGGISGEHNVSLNTGGQILEHLRSDILNKKYKAFDIFIDKDGSWYLNGLVIEPVKLSTKLDLVINALHGEYGEDGKIQQLFEQLNIPYTGSRPMSSAIGYNKLLTKNEFIRLGIKTPLHFVVKKYDQNIDISIEQYAINSGREIINKIPPPWIVKPINGGSSIGVFLCKTFESLVNALKYSAIEDVSVFVEELIQGKEATVGVIDNFRGKNTYVLPPIEIRVPNDTLFFDYKVKYNGKSQEICPGNFKEEEKRELEEMATLIHTGLDLRHYSRSDFMVHPKKGIYALEVNTLPGLTSESLIPKSLNAVGSNLPEFIEHLILLTLKNK